MRIKLNKTPKRGETRFKLKFLWFPIRLKDEIRWLEYVVVFQVYTRSDIIFWEYYYWDSINFEDK